MVCDSYAVVTRCRIMYRFMKGELEDNVFCGPSCVFINDLTPRAKYPKGSAGYKKTLVKEEASIGANATIVCGNTIGKFAMVDAGAVVTKDIPDGILVAGVPAKEIGRVNEMGNIIDLYYKKRSDSR